MKKLTLMIFSALLFVSQMSFADIPGRGCSTRTPCSGNEQLKRVKGKCQCVPKKLTSRINNHKITE